MVGCRGRGYWGVEYGADADVPLVGDERFSEEELGLFVTRLVPRTSKPCSSDQSMEPSSES